MIASTAKDHILIKTEHLSKRIGTKENVLICRAGRNS